MRSDSQGLTLIMCPSVSSTVTIPGFGSYQSIKADIDVESKRHEKNETPGIRTNLSKNASELSSARYISVRRSTMEQDY